MFGPHYLRKREADGWQRNGRHLWEREEFSPDERILKRLEEVGRTEVQPVVQGVGLAIHTRGEVNGQFLRLLTASYRVACRLWPVNVAKGKCQKPADRYGRQSRMVRGTGAITLEPHPVVDFARGAYRSTDRVDDGGAANLCDQRIHMLGDGHAGVSVKTRPEDADIDVIAAIPQSAAGCADMMLPVHAARPRGIRQIDTRNGPSNGAQPLFGMRKRKKVLILNLKVFYDEIENSGWQVGRAICDSGDS